jgi:hypothetical protein
MDEMKLDEIKKLKKDNERLLKWVSDLQSGMYINCVYCGHRYEPKEDTPCAMSRVLKDHIEQCLEHPLSALKRKNEQMLRLLFRAAMMASAQSLSDELKNNPNIKTKCVSNSDFYEIGLKKIGSFSHNLKNEEEIFSEFKKLVEKEMEEDEKKS